MLLVIDVGNSHTVLGLFQDKHLYKYWRITTDQGRTVDEYAVLLSELMGFVDLKLQAVEAVMLSCVVPPVARSIESLCRRYLQVEPLTVGPGIKTGMPIQYDNPKEVGADRVVNGVAAFHKYRQALIVVDFGTATTFDVISSRGEYIGGAIAPGLNISAEALYLRASKLPRVEFAQPKQVTGKNTVESMQSGLFYGYVGLVDGIVDRICQEQRAQLEAIATGGLAKEIGYASTTISKVEPFLTLEGLQLLYERNRG